MLDSTRSGRICGQGSRGGGTFLSPRRMNRSAANQQTIVERVGEVKHEFLQSNVKGDVRRATDTHTHTMPSDEQIRVSQQAIALEMAGNGEVQFLQRPEKPASSNDVLDSTSSASPDKSIHKLHGATPGRPSAACCHPPMRTCLSQVRHSPVMS